MLLADRMKHLTPSATMAISAKAKSLKAEGKDVIDFGCGEPDFDTPQNVKIKAIEAINLGFTKYTPAGGTPELKKAIALKFKRDNGIDYSPEQIIVSSGGKHCLYNFFQVVVNPGDEVIIPAPYWVSFPPQVQLAGGLPVIINTSVDHHFKMTPQEFENHITKKTKIVIINSPSNPTGMGYSENELRQITEIACNHNILIATDEMYEQIIFDGFKHVSIATFNPKAYELTFTFNAVSKTHAMTGWRIGYVAGQREIIKAMDNLQSQSTSNPCSISQKAAIEALLGSQTHVPIMVKAFEKRRDLILGLFQQCPKIKCPKPIGAFYVFPDISFYLGKQYESQTIKNSTDLANYLLEQAHVAVVPGEAFGEDRCIRISYATSDDLIKKGMERIIHCLNKLE